MRPRTNRGTGDQVLVPGSMLTSLYLDRVCWGGSESSWEQAMQRVRGSTIASISVSVHPRLWPAGAQVTVLWGVKDTKYLWEHRACIRGGHNTGVK